MHSKLRKVLAGVATAALSLIGLSPLAAVSPAAATCTPDGSATIRITNPSIQPGVNAYDGSSWNAYSISQGWLPAGTRGYVQYLDAGTAFSITYSVTDSCGAPMTNQPVQLRVNANYAGANATFTAYGQNIPRGSSGNYGETVLPAINSDSQGSVTFTLTNIDDPVTAETRPTNLYDSPPDPPLASELKTAIVPTIANTSTIVDMYWAHFVQPLGSQCSPSGHKTIRMTTPAITPGTNAYNATSWVAQYITAGSAVYVQYITAGTTFSLTYTVTDSCGSPIAGQAVSLIVNKDWSCSNATFTAASVSIGPDHCNYAGGQTQLSAQTTDSSGHVTFTLTNTNDAATAESLPVHIYEDPTSHTNQVKTNIVPFIDGTESADYYYAHFVRDPNATIAPCIPTATKVIRFLNPAMVPGRNAYDATGWVEPYITKGSKAYLQYLHAGDAMKLTYIVTNNCGTPFADQPVKLKINANWSCSNATFTADGKAVGPDYCNGNGETILAARNTNSAGFVTFDLTNTNAAAAAEPTPGSPTSPPSAAVTAAKQEVKTNIQPYIDGTEVIDLYFAHFTRDPQVSLTAPASVVKGVRSKITLNLMGSNGQAVASTRVSLKVTGGGTVAGSTLVGSSSGNLYVVTDASGNASVNYLAGASDSGPVTLTASYTDAAGLSTSKSATFTLANAVATTPTVKVTGGIGSVKINAVNAKGKSLTVVKAGSRKSYNYGVHGDNETFTLIAAPGNVTVTVFVDGKPQTFPVKVN